jgi:hypothetical protein
MSQTVGSSMATILLLMLLLSEILLPMKKKRNRKKKVPTPTPIPEEQVVPDSVWDQRRAKRQQLVDRIKTTTAWTAARQPPGPDPCDREISKRDWESKCQTWRLIIATRNNT